MNTKLKKKFDKLTLEGQIDLIKTNGVCYANPEYGSKPYGNHDLFFIVDTRLNCACEFSTLQEATNALWSAKFLSPFLYLISTTALSEAINLQGNNAKKLEAAVAAESKADAATHRFFAAPPQQLQAPDDEPSHRSIVSVTRTTP